MASSSLRGADARPRSRPSSADPTEDQPGQEHRPGQDHRRGHEVAALLRQLSLGLSAYRLFPDDLEQPAFVAAVGRVRDTAARALLAGPVIVEVRGADLHGAWGPLPRDEVAERLALALYDRRAQRLTLRSTPDGHDLAALYQALSSPPDEVRAAGGIGAMVRSRGVASLEIGDLAPQAGARTAKVDTLSVEQQALWDRLQDAAALATDLLAVAATGDPRGQGEAVYRRLTTLVGVLPDEVADRPEIYQRVHDAVDRLPPALRRSVHAAAFARMRGDAFAERLVGTMTDAELARMLAEFAETPGPSPVELAERMVAERLRRDDLVDLTASLMAGREDGGTIVPVAPGMAAPSAVTTTVTELLARRLVDESHSDVQAIRAQFPADERAVAEDALASLHDYVRNESDAVRLNAVLGSWAIGMRDALADDDADRLELVAMSVRRAIAGVGPEATQVVERRLREVLTPGALGRVLERAAKEGPAAVLPLLRPLGAAAVSGVLDALADESDRSARAVMIGLLADLAVGHLDEVATRIDDQRWYVARNAVTVLHRAGGASVVPLLVQASRSPASAVRREVVRGLVAVAPASAVPHLRRMAADPDPTVRTSALSALGGVAHAAAASALAHVVRTSTDATDRRRALDELGRHRANEALTLLDDLAVRGPKPRLPRGLRRGARRLATERRRGGPPSGSTTVVAT